MGSYHDEYRPNGKVACAEIHVTGDGEGGVFQSSINSPQEPAEDAHMGLQELSDLIDRIQGALDEVEYRLTGLLLIARSDRHNYLVRSARDVARTSASLLQLEAERTALVSHLAVDHGFSHTARMTEIAKVVPSPWSERFVQAAADLKSSLDRIGSLQSEVRGVCQSKIGVFDTALTLIGGQGQTYGADGATTSRRSKVLSESM